MSRSTICPWNTFFDQPHVFLCGLGASFDYQTLESAMLLSLRLSCKLFVIPERCSLKPLSSSGLKWATSPDFILDKAPSLQAITNIPVNWLTIIFMCNSWALFALSTRQETAIIRGGRTSGKVFLAGYGPECYRLLGHHGLELLARRS